MKNIMHTTQTTQFKYYYIGEILVDGEWEPVYDGTFRLPEENRESFEQMVTDIYPMISEFYGIENPEVVYKELNVETNEEIDYKVTKEGITKLS